MKCPVIVIVKRYRAIVINYAHISGIVEKYKPVLWYTKVWYNFYRQEVSSKKWRVLLEIFI